MSFRAIMMASLNNALANKNIQFIFTGDSLTAGVGTTGTGSSISGQYNGPNSYPLKTISKLAGGVNVTPLIRPFPGQTADQFNVNDLARTISLFDYDNYTDIYCIVFFGANDLTQFNPATFEANLITQYAALRAAGARIITVPVLSRKDSIAAAMSPAYDNISRRNIFNSWLAANWSTYCDAVVDLSPYPEIFADDAPDNATYFAAPDLDGYSKLHLADAGAELLATAVAKTINRLARTIPSLTVTRVNYAANFISATGITDSIQIAAITTMVNSLISNKLWHRLACIYPFVGGNPTSHKFNLKNPVDSDDANRLTFVGSPQHDANGVTWLSDSYANTHYNYGQPVFGSYIIFEQASNHYYARTNTSPGVDMGGSGTNDDWLSIKLGGSAYTSVNDNDGNGISVSYNDVGFFSTNRNDANTTSLYRNGVKVFDRNAGIKTQGPTNIWLGCTNYTSGGGTPYPIDGVVQYPSNRNCAYAAIGYGLSAEEEVIHYNIVQAFQTALGRDV